jgi:hypothetical protein
VAEINSKPLLELEQELRLMIRRIAADSENAIHHLWDDERGCFWRDTEQRKTKSADTHEFFPTVTYRSAEALLDLMFRHPDWLPPKRKAIIADRVSKLFLRSLVDIPSALDAPDSSVRNPFTTALYLVTACRANRLGAPDIVKYSNVTDATKELFKACLDPESPYFLERHPFMQFHILRALTALWPQRTGGAPEESVQLRAQIVKDVKAVTKKLLAKYMLNQLAPSDSVGLVFCAATLAFEDDPDDNRYVLPALTVGFKAQDSTGCWPLGRILKQNRGDLGQRGWGFTISTYEIAWAASETLLKLLRQREVAPGSKTLSVLDCLLAAGRYAQKSSVELPAEDLPRRGWCSDQPYGWLLVESWTSANVLQSVISLSELIDERICNQTLKTFEFLDPRSKDWPSWKRWDKLRERAGPEDEHPVFETLNNQIINKIKNDPRKLPSSTAETVSALFFGPPGTSKTTLVHALADGLGWPIVMLSPGDFIEKGLEYIEAQTREVFARLHKLHRVVVLFDECDELFRNREPTELTDQVRSITAFVTASMLPKLQDLHDRGRVVFCICTNKFETLDPAMKRKGRIDHIIPVGPPQKTYRQKIVSEKLEALDSKLKEPLDIQLREAVIAQLTHDTDGFVRGEIQRTCKVLLSSEVDWTDGAAIIGAASKAADKIQESITIPREDYEKFKKVAEKYFSR